jgi:hypothetical protein
MLITEMRNTTYRQPEWYRYVAAFAGDKDVVVVENPYGGVVPELVQMLAEGRGHDLFRLSLYEGAAFGANMTVPYGAWMGATIQDSFHPPHDLAVEIQTFLAEHVDLYSKQTWHEVAVVFSVESTRELIGKADASDNLTNARDLSVRVPYRAVTESLSAASVPFDVVIFPDGDTAPDRVTGDALARYSTLVLPDCFSLTQRQADALRTALDAGTLVVVTDRFGESLPTAQREELLSHSGIRHASDDDVASLLPHGPQVEVSADLGVNVARLADGAAAVHVVAYEYDADRDAVRRHQDVALSVRLPFPVGSAVYHRADGPSGEVAVSSKGDVCSLTLPRTGVYGVVELRASDGAS